MGDRGIVRSHLRRALSLRPPPTPLCLLLPPTTYLSLTANLDLPRVRPFPCLPRDSNGDMCTGPEDTGEPKEEWGVGREVP